MKPKIAMEIYARNNKTQWALFNIPPSPIDKLPNRVTCYTSTLTDHILTNTQNNISRSSVIDTAISDHSMIYCTRKCLKPKYNKHKELNFRSLKNY